MKKSTRILSLLLVAILILSVFSSFTYAEVGDDLLNTVVKDTAEFMYKEVSNPQVGSIGGEWAVLGLARSGINIPDDYYHKYYNNVVEYVKGLDGNLHDKKYTEYSRLIVALTAIGKDPRDVGGYNLLTALGDFDKTVFQGLNGPIWALIALDSGNYPMPINKAAKKQASRDMYIDMILDRQLDDGGWTLMAGDKSRDADPDITGMALQALAKYQDREDVKKACDKALTCISNMQLPNGGFNSWGSENSESCVQIIVALAELGVDLEDERFVKNGNTLLDNLLTYYRQGQGFLHTQDGTGSSQMAAEQGFYGVVAAKRFRNGENSLYRMLDPIEIGETINKSFGKGLEGKNSDINVMPIVNHNSSFIDISGVNAHKNQKAIESLASRNIINGKSEGKFGPNDNMTRAEFATIVVKSLGLPVNGSNKFKDINKSDWFYDYVLTATNYGIVNGISEDEFNPSGSINKEEAAAMIMRASLLAGIIEEEGTNPRDILAQFEDYVLVSEWAMKPISFCVDKNILSSNDMEINPKKDITRAEVAQMIFNMLGEANLL